MYKLKLLVAILIIFTLVQPVAGWGVSTHHDQAIIISKALRESPSIPQAVRDNIDSDFIYSTSLAPDDWRNVTGTWGTWHFNMAENAYWEFQRIYEAWRNGDFDNAIGRIGIVLHYIGDVMYIPHNQGVRRWYWDHISPIGSTAPLWGAYEEAGKYFTANYYYDGPHYSNHQVEAYTDSDSAWYPTRPENYGPTDDGTLSWFLNSYLYDVGHGPGEYPEDDYPSYTICDTALEQHIIQSNPYTLVGPNDVNDKIDNRWLYWRRTKDPSIAKMDADNTIRLAYNGVYRALRDAWNWRYNQGYPDAPFYWEWPTKTQYLSLNDDLYREGMDTVRWVSQRPGAPTETFSPEPPSPQQPLILLVMATISSSLFTLLLSKLKMLGENGISEIVGEILLIGLITTAMTMIAIHVSSTAVSPYRNVDFLIWVENAGPPPTNSIKVILYHAGGDTLGIPTGPESEFYILATYSGRTPWENKARWNGLVFSDPSGGFGINENVVAIIRHNDARVNIGDRITITIYDYYAKRILCRKSITVENSIYS